MSRVLIPEAVAPETVAFLEEQGYEVLCGGGRTEAELIEALRGCQAIMVRVTNITRRVMDECPCLRVIAKHGAGYDNIDVRAAREKGIALVYAPAANTRSVAEHAVALMLACSRQLRATNMAYAQGDYHIKDTIPLYEMYGKTLALLGCGRIARAVAQIAGDGFGMRITAYDPYLPEDKRPETIHFEQSAEALFAHGDYVSVHIPATPQTQGMIGETLLRCMKPTAYFINTSRGSLVDHAALIAAAEHGRIAGAGLDVSDPEPCPSASGLFACPRILLTPHTGAASREAMVRMGLDAAKGIDDVLRGRTPAYPIP